MWAAECHHHFLQREQEEHGSNTQRGDHFLFHFYFTINNIVYCLYYHCCASVFFIIILDQITGLLNFLDKNVCHCQCSTSGSAAGPGSVFFYKYMVFLEKLLIPDQLSGFDCLLVCSNQSRSVNPGGCVPAVKFHILIEIRTGSGMTLSSK